MGTNYYARFDICEKCGRYDEIHIGKSSGGWCFSLHIDPEKGLSSLDDWIAFLETPFISGNKPKIYDEYGDEHTIDSFLATIKNRSWRDGTFPDAPYHGRSWEDFHRSNHSEFGPNGLLRHRIDGTLCIGHGEGTWDYITGEFS